MASIIMEYHDQFVRHDGDGLWTTAHLKAINFIIEARDHVTRTKAQRLYGQLQALSDRPPVSDLPALPLTARNAVVAPARPPQEAKGKNLYDAITSYLATLNGKRVSDAHKWRSLGQYLR